MNEDIRATEMVTEAMKIAELKAKVSGKKIGNYDISRALVVLYPETKTWAGHKLMNIIRAIKG